MNVMVSKGLELSKAADLACGIVSRKQTVPALAAVIVSTAPDALLVKATDTEQFMSISVPASIYQPGAAAVNATRFRDLLDEIATADFLKLSTDEKGNLSILTGGGRVNRFTLAGIASIADFPVMPTLDFTNRVVVKAELLLTALKQASYAASEDDSRYALNGVRLSLEGLIAQLAATDGHRLVVTKTPVEAAGQAAAVIVPRSAMRTIYVLLKDAGEGEVTLGFGEPATTIAMLSGARQYSVRLVEGVFPNFETIIGPALKHPHRVRVSSEALAAAVRQAAVISGDLPMKPVKITLVPDGLRVTAEQAEAGDAEVHVDGDLQSDQPESLDMPKVAFGVNARYLLDYLETVIPVEIELKVKDGLSPVVVTGEACPTYCVMPIRM